MRSGLVVLCGLGALLSPTLLLAARGDLDPTFGRGGKVTTDFGGSEVGWAVAVQRDRRVVVAGYELDPGPSGDFVLARYTSRGHLDRSFDRDGRVATDFGAGSDAAFDVKIQRDGKIVAAGESRRSGASAMALARYNRDGSLDSAFGEGGKVLGPFGPGSIDRAQAVLLQADGKIVAGGRTRSGPASSFALVRYLRDGALDPTFGSGGRVTTPIRRREDDRVYALALQPDGKLVAAGGSFEGPSDVVLTRYNRDGSLDRSFGRDGIVIASFAPRDLVPFRVVVQRDGKVLVAGYGGVTRFTADGRLDVSFGQGGRAESGNVQAGTAEIQADGKILVIGTVVTGRPATGDFGVARLTAGGRLDLTYGRRGSTVTPFASGTDDQPVDAVLLSDGKLVVAGMTGATPGYGPWDFAVARYVAIPFCVVPAVRGRKLAVARTRLVRANCRLGKVRRSYSGRVRRGRVISQRPRVGARLAELAKVDLVVSRGPRR
jgi:uncharacterized delta-60 repeat protein